MAVEHKQRSLPSLSLLMLVKINNAARDEEKRPRSIMGVDDFSVVVLDQSVKQVEVRLPKDQQSS